MKIRTLIIDTIGLAALFTVCAGLPLILWGLA